MNGPEPGTGTPQAGTPAAPQAGAPAAGQEPAAAQGQEPAAGAQQGTDGGETPEQKATRLERELGEARREAARHRTRATELERTQQAAAQAGMTELERATAAQQAAETERDRLQGQLREQALRSATTAVAAKLNYRNPELAYRLLDQGDIEFDDAGQPKNADKLLRELATREPYLVKAAGQDYGGGNRGGQPEGAPGMNELLRAALGKG